MPKALTPYITRLLTNKDIKIKVRFYINSVDLSDYLISSQIENNKEFGSASATFTLNNDKGIFGEGGSQKIEVGDVVDYREYFEGDSMEWKKFYGNVNQRSITKSADTRSITLVCLDYISTLQFLDIDLEIEAEKVEITEEVLTPNYLDAPNDNLAQIFDFANDALADNPLPILQIRNKDTSAIDPLFDGFEILYADGQLKLGFPLNARVNYDLIAVSYWAYTKGKYVEDIIEEILTLSDGYNNFLFGETTAQLVIDNHLTETFFNVEGTNTDLLTANTTSSSITIDTQLTSDVGAGSTTIYVTSTTGFSTSGEGNINGDIFTWSSKTSTSLSGIPATGSYALHNHKTNSYVEYTYSYPAGQVWYHSFSNITTTLTTSDFVLPNNVTMLYQDKRNGRIILDSAISLSFVVKCNTNYSFKTIQSTGIQLNKISFRSREVENRFEALNKIRGYLAPNYIIRTLGDSKIWASYLSQETTADYTLQLETNIQYMEDEDLYTRVIFYRKNKNPTNLMFSDGIDFVTTGQSYKAITTNSELTSLREEDNYYVYGSSISQVGKITANVIKPIVYINSVPINNTSQVIAGQSVIIEVTTRTETSQESGGK